MNNIQCGIDIIEVRRIAEIAKRNSHFLKRVFTEQEIAYCSKKKFKWEHFAVRFAAKEAVWKALGHKGIRLQNIGVRNASDGRPEAVIQGKHKQIAKYIVISLSHTKEYAAAMAVYERGKGPRR
jgi:holo-[acyl-carrier protein] synthase